MPHRGRARITLATAVLVVIALSGGTVCAQTNPYRAVENWVKPPAGRTLGAVSDVAIDRDDNLWALERCGANTCAGSDLTPILKFDPSGKLLKGFGAGMFEWPHGIYVDRDGNVWVTDAEAKNGRGQQVFKFSPEGEVLLTLGTAGVAGNGPDTFHAPSDVVVAPNGDIFVADGHGGDTNARIVKFSKDGKFIKAWGKKGSGPGEFDRPHAIVIDSRGRLFVGDRGNGRIQIFDQDGNFLEEWKQFGGPSAIFIDANDNIYASDGESSMIPHPPDYEYGIKIGSIKDGKVKAFIPSFGRDHIPVSHVESVVADSMGNLYVSSTYDGGARDGFPQILAAAEAAGTRTRNKNLTKFVKK